MKKRTKPARLERRVRVTFFLPAEKAEEKGALDDVIKYLHIQRKNPVLPVTGFTHSARHTAENLFCGHWWRQEKKKELEIQGVTLFIIDFLGVVAEWKLDHQLARLKTKISKCYADHRCRQKEIWLTKEDIYRYA